MKTLSASLIVEKNKLASGNPWILLLRVTLDDATVLRLAAYPEDVVFATETYNAFPMTIEPIGESGDGNIGSLRVNVANVNRLISSYVENADLLGNAVTLRIVHSAHLTNAADKLDFSYRVNRIAITDQAASFELGHEDLMRLQLPRQRYFRSRCRFIYEDDHCSYPDDEFGLTTKQTLASEQTTGGPFTRLHGWAVANAHECTTFDASVTAAGYLTCSNKTGSVKEWWDANRQTAYAYRVLEGDIDAETLLVNTAAWTADGLWAMLLVQSVTTAGHWIAFAWVHDTGSPATRVVALSTVSDVTTQNDPTGTWYRYARITRTGNAVAWQCKAAVGDSWTTLHSETRADMGSQLRVGFTVCPRDAAAAVTTVQWDYLRVAAGGLASCDYTLDGPNGCRVHANQIHYGGAPALPVGRLYGV